MNTPTVGDFFDLLVAQSKNEIGKSYFGFACHFFEEKCFPNFRTLPLSDARIQTFVNALVDVMKMQIAVSPQAVRDYNLRMSHEFLRELHMVAVSMGMFRVVDQPLTSAEIQTASGLVETVDEVAVLTAKG